MINEDKVFDLLERIYVELQETKAELKETKIELKETKTELKADIIENRKAITKLETKIENDHGQKLEALFDGQKQIFDKLDGIEKEVTKHEEFIMKRVK